MEGKCAKQTIKVWKLCKKKIHSTARKIIFQRVNFTELSVKEWVSDEISGKTSIRV